MTSLQSFLAALKNRFELIWNYFVERRTNVFTESVNHKIKLIKRRTFGFTWISRGTNHDIFGCILPGLLQIKLLNSSTDLLTPTIGDTL